MKHYIYIILLSICFNLNAQNDKEINIKINTEQVNDSIPEPKKKIMNIHFDKKLFKLRIKKSRKRIEAYFNKKKQKFKERRMKENKTGWIFRIEYWKA